MLKRSKWNNHGSTLIIVLVVIAFVSILGTVTVTSAMMNLKMKEVDKQSKKGFYTAEEAVDEIYAGIGMVCMDSLKKCYESELSSLTIEEKDDYLKTVNIIEKSNDDCNIDFRKAYMTELVSRLFDKQWMGNAEEIKDQTNDLYEVHGKNEPEKAGEETFVQKLNDYIEADNPNAVLKVDSIESKKIQITDSTYGGTFKNYSIELKNCKIIYSSNKDGDGYYSEVTIDCSIGLPDVLFNFVESKSGPTTFGEYSLIGCNGIMLSNHHKLTLDHTKIYAGKSNGIQIGYQSSLFSKSSMAVTPGNILLGSNVVGSNTKASNTGAIYNESEDSQIWCSNLEISEDVKGSELNLDGSTFVQDDLTINGDDNQANVNGNYIGWSYEENKSEMSGADRSSAMIVNGSNSTLNLKDVTSLILGGRSYIGLKQDSVLTGDSVSLKADQEIYLVPDSFLKKKNNSGLGDDAHYMNPVATQFAEDVDIVIPNDFSLSKWLDKDNPVYAARNDDQIYYYLNIKKEYKDDFMNAVLNYDLSSGNDVYLAALKNLVVSNTTQLQQQALLLDKGDVFLNGALVGAYIPDDLKDATISGNASVDQDVTFSDTPSVTEVNQEDYLNKSNGFEITRNDLNTRYILLTTALFQSRFYSDEKDLDGSQSVTSLKRKVYGAMPDSESYNGVRFNTIDYTQHDVFTNFINEKWLKGMCKNHAYKLNGNDGEICYITTAEPNNDKNLVIGTTKETGVQDISKGIIVTNGDVTVKENFDGLIFAKGKIIVDGDDISISNSYGSMEALIQQFSSSDQDVIRNVFRAWNEKEEYDENVHTNPSSELSDLNYKNIITFHNWRNRSVE